MSYDYIVGIIVFVHGIGPGHLCYMKEIEILASKGFKVFALKTSIYDTPRRAAVVISAYDI